MRGGLEALASTPLGLSGCSGRASLGVQRRGVRVSSQPHQAHKMGAWLLGVLAWLWTSTPGAEAPEWSSGQEWPMGGAVSAGGPGPTRAGVSLGTLVSEGLVMREMTRGGEAQWLCGLSGDQL